MVGAKKNEIKKLVKQLSAKNLQNKKYTYREIKIMLSLEIYLVKKGISFFATKSRKANRTKNRLNLKR